MTMPFKFNTLAYANKLVETGMSKEQAEAQSLALHEALSEGTVSPGEQLIHKTDLITRIEAVKHDLVVHVEAVRHDVIIHIETVKHDLIVRIDAVKHDVIVQVDTVKHDLSTRIGAVKNDVDILKRKVNALFWIVGAVLGLQVVQIGAMIYIIGRLP